MLVADYRFWEPQADGSVWDNSGNDHHGTVVGTVVRGVPGLGKAATFFGAGPELSYVRIPSHPDFSIGTSGLTIEAIVAPSTMTFAGSPAPLCAGYPAANYISFANKHGVNADAEWLMRMYPETAVGGAGCGSRAGRVSAYVFSPESGLGSGAYHQAVRVPGVYLTVRAAFDPPSAPNARVHLWMNGVKKPPSPADLYSHYGVVPVAGDADVLLGAGITDSVPVQFHGAFDRFRVWSGFEAP